MLLSIRLKGISMRKLVMLYWLPSLPFMLTLLVSVNNSSAGTFASWRPLIEGQNYSSYELALDGRVLEGFELCWYATSNSDVKFSGYVEIRVFNGLGELVSFYKYGSDVPYIFPSPATFPNNVTGWHIVYGILPKRTPVNKVVFNLYLTDGFPRLVAQLSWLSPWNPNLDVNFHPLSYEGSVSWSGYESLPRGKVWAHAAGLGTIFGWGSPQKSSVDYVVWKSFDAPTPPAWFDRSASVYIDSTYAGTINVIGEGFTGQGGYCAAIQTGIGQGFWITDAIAQGYEQCLQKVSSHSDEGFIQDLTQNVASGVVDISLDIMEASIIGYIKFALESAQLISTLFDIDQGLAEAKTVIFNNVSLDKDRRVYAWIRIKGLVVALGFAHSILSFYTDGTFEGDLHGNRGIELGSVLIHYQGPYSPEVVSTSPENGAINVSPDPKLKFVFSKNIVLANQSGIVLKRVNVPGVIPCINNIGETGNVLLVKPKQSLSPNSQYELEISAGAVRVKDSSTTNVVPYVLRFTTGEPFLIIGSEPSNGAIGFPLLDTLSLTFNDVVIGKGDAFNSIVLKDSHGNVIGQTAKGVDYCDLLGTNVSLRLKVHPSLLPNQQYVWEIPKDAFRNSNGNPNFPVNIRFTTASPVQVVETTPKNNEVDVPVNRLYICICFSGSVVPGNNFNKITLKTGDRSVGLETSVGDNRMYLQPKTPLEFDKVYALTIPEGALKDPGTGAPSLQYILSFRTAAPPKITQTYPKDNSTNVYRDQVVSITFSEEIRLSGEGYEPIIFPKTDSGKKISLALNIEHKTLILKPDLPEPVFPANTKITITVPKGSITDLRGTPLQYDYSFSFSTGINAAPPVVIWTSPSDGETNVQLDSVIYIRFNKSIKEGPNWNNISLSTASGQAVEVSKVINYDVQLELHPKQQLKKNTQYVAYLPSGCVSSTLLSAPMAEPYSFSFRTQFRSGSQQPTGIRIPFDNKGDVNKDGKVDAGDAILTLRISVGLLELSKEQLYLADLDEDGEISANDAYIILEKVIGLLAPNKLVSASEEKMPLVALGEVKGRQYETIQVPIEIGNFDMVRAGEIKVSYDSRVLRVVDVLSCKEDELISYNIAEPGIVYIAFVSTGVPTERQLAQIMFQAIAKGVSALRLEYVKLYGGSGAFANVQKKDGCFRPLGPIPACDTLLQNYPNPFNPDTWIPYQLSEETSVSIQIFDISGKLVRELNLGVKAPGFYLEPGKAAHWDGKNEMGEDVASGVYFYTLRTNKVVTTKKMIISR